MDILQDNFLTLQFRRISRMALSLSLKNFDNRYGTENTSGKKCETL